MLKFLHIRTLPSDLIARSTLEVRRPSHLDLLYLARADATRLYGFLARTQSTPRCAVDTYRQSGAASLNPSHNVLRGT